MFNETITFSDSYLKFENWFLEIICYLCFDIVISNSAKCAENNFSDTNRQQVVFCSLKLLTAGFPLDIFLAI